MAQAVEAQKEVKFEAKLGLFDATMIVMGSMIGSGIFIAPSIMAGYMPIPLFLILLWVLGGILTAFGAIAYGELAGMMPKAGGQYVFLREAYNPLLGFLYGWTLFFVIQSGFIAAVAIAFAKYLGVFIPALSENNVILTLNIFGWNFTLNSAQLVGVAVIAFLTCINCFGVVFGALVQNLFTVSKIAAGVIGILFEDKIETVFQSPKLTSIFLMVTGLILISTRFAKNNPEKDFNFVSSFLVGVAQAFAILPGISRSGSTISAGMLAGINGVKSARFSFLLSLPAILGATILKTKEIFEFSLFDKVPLLLFSALISFITGYIAIKFLLKVISRGNFSLFAYYCLTIGLIGLIFLK